MKNTDNIKNSVKTGTEPVGRAKGYKNLIPGANKNGRPKGKLNYDTRVDMAIAVLSQKYVDEMNKKNAKVKGYKPITVDDVDIEGDIFMQHLNKARAGDRHFIDSFLDRRHGKAKQPVELSGGINATIEHEIKIKEAQERIRKFQDKWFGKKNK